MKCDELLISLIIGIVSGVISGLIVNCYLKEQEKEKLSLIREKILTDIVYDVKMYIQLFINKPISFDYNDDKNNLVNKISKLLVEIKKLNDLSVLKNKIIISKPLLLQLRSNLNKIVDNEFYFRHNELLNNKKVELVNSVIKNIDFYLNSENNKYEYTGITIELTRFLESIRDVICYL